MATFKKTAGKLASQPTAQFESSDKESGSEKALELFLVIICGGLFVVITFFS